MRFGIIGGGFGLYGWLPAVVEARGSEIVTLERYRDTLRRRSELSAFEGRASFVPSFESLLSKCDCLIVARRPQDQMAAVQRALTLGWRGVLLLEKPLAPDPPSAAQLLAECQASNVRIMVGFSLMQTPWSEACGGLLASGAADALNLKWNFLAHHYRNDLETWKRKVSQGGGALRFFAIHLLGWLAPLASWKVTSATKAELADEDTAVTFSLIANGRIVNVLCDSASAGPPTFSVQALLGDRQVRSWNLADPFAGAPLPKDGAQDRRVPMLVPIIEQIMQDKAQPAHSYLKHIELWAQVEAARNIA